MKINKIDKSILNRIDILEEKYPIIDIESTKEQIDALIEWIDDYLGYSIKNRIDFLESDYKNTNDLERAVFEKLTVKELKILVYSIKKDKKIV